MLQAIGQQPPFDLTETEDWWLVPAQLFDGRALLAGAALRVSGGRVRGVFTSHPVPADGNPVWRTRHLAVPGFVDLQINGGGGVLFNNAPTIEGLATIGVAHRASGTTRFLPTLITDEPGILDRAAQAAIAAFGRFGVAGIHLEGPHISQERRGTHKAAFIRPIDEHTFDVVGRLRAAGLPVLITLAPECVPPGTIGRLCALGTVVSLGHTAASSAEVRAAIAEGARSATHLFNGMPPMTSRDPAVVGTVLDSDVFCGFIADGHHVADTMIRIAVRSRPRPGRMVLVSDAMPTVNGPSDFTLYGETIRLVDGRLVNEAGSLAGVHIDMAASVRRLVDTVGLPLEDVLMMSSSTPATLMGLTADAGSFAAGTRADIVLLDQEIKVSTVITAV
ncbi:MAG: N-acetylglucosamine-6-phosphate deacetylase [Azospirillaceae bacterium]|nr:N-acetylglucosamine-6-phosphate deacetylase [Azospirillaceae bacterium]